jgi:hypothetical protein
VSDKDSRKKQDPRDNRDEKQSRFNGDYDLYDWSGKQVDSGADVRRKGSDR